MIDVHLWAAPKVDIMSGLDGNASVHLCLRPQLVGVEASAQLACPVYNSRARD